MFGLIWNNPVQVQYSFIFNWDNFDYLFISFSIEWRLSDGKFTEIIIFNIVKFLLNLLNESLDILLPIYNKFHKIGWIFTIVKRKQHLS